MAPLTLCLSVLAIASLVAVVGQVRLAGSLPAGQRRSLERVVLLAFGVAALSWSWRAGLAVAVQDWVWTIAGAAVAALSVMSAVLMLRRPLRPDGTRT
jgi:hypothetical protein